MASVSSDIASLLKPAEPYTATASILNGVVDPTTSTVTGDRTTGLFAKGTNELGKDDFLKLLTTQMQYQDPMSPMDNTQFVSQLAQFSALEGNNNIEKAINNLNDSFKSTADSQKYSAQSITNTSAVSLIGKTVTMAQTSVQWYGKGGETVPITIQLGSNQDATVKLVDKDGNVVKTLQTEGKDSENSSTIKWDGTKDDGTYASAGQYTIQIDGQDKDPSLYAFVKDMVSGVRFTSNGALVKIGGTEISIGNVLDVSTGSGSSDINSLSPSTAVSLLGKEVRVMQDKIVYRQMDNEVHNLKINAGNRQSVQVQLADGSGNIVYTGSLPVDSNGIATLSWDGQYAGGLAPAGTYTLSIAGEENDPSLYGFDAGKVDGVTNLGGASLLRVNGKTISLSDIIDIADPSTAGEAI
jgi:flagellar basal-body rod modification protein FlgD